MDILKLIKQRRTLLIMSLDMLLVGGIYLCCIVFLNNQAGLLTAWERLIWTLALVAVYVLFLFAFRMYASLWRYAEVEEFFLCAGVSLAAGFLYTAVYALFIHRIPLVINLMAVLVITLALVSYRFIYRIVRNGRMKSSCDVKKRLLIVGAGLAATSLISEIKKNPNNRFLPVCVVDDDPDKLGHSINGLKIRGDTETIPSICREFDVDTIFVCIPSATAEQRRRILSLCSATKASVRILPEVYAAMTDPVKLQKNLRAIRIEDLIGRQEKSFDRSYINNFIRDKVVLVTGGGGSIGSELCRQVALSEPKKLVVLDIYENNAYSVQQELLSVFGDTLDMTVEIASIRDKEKMDILFARYRPQVVFHAAAHKHVPLMEHNPEEALKNNVWGTLNVVNVAQKYGADKFVLISSDKAVNPTNFMGATKRLAEMIVQSRRGVSATQFVAVRFGNVLGSSGSVVPLFEKQIERGGPVTVTHPQITRFFMTIPESVELVLHAAMMAKDGEIFVLDMGEPVRILTLAENMIRLSGMRPYEDIDIVFTGLRPGEKLYEELLMNEEGLDSTANSRIFIGHQPPITMQQVERLLVKLHDAVSQGDKLGLLRTMQEVVPTYHPDYSHAIKEEDVATVTP